MKLNTEALVSGQLGEQVRGRLLGHVRASLGALGLAGLLLVTGCDQQNAEKLVEDVSTEADVKRLYGEPRKVTVAADGGRTLDYPRQPEGYTNYVMVIGADGKLKSLRQLLNPDNFAKVQPGMNREEVVAILGPFARERRFDLQKQFQIQWRYRDTHDIKFFGVTFDQGGRVVSTESVLESSQMGDAGR